MSGINQSNAKDYLPLITAMAEGKILQMSWRVCGNKYEWRDIDPKANLSFVFDASDYRVKPEPKIVKRYQNVYSDGGLGEDQSSIIDCDRVKDVSRKRIGTLVIKTIDSEHVEAEFIKL